MSALARLNIRSLFAAIAILLALLSLALRPAYAEVQVTTVEAANGVSAWLVRDTALPLVHVKLAWRGGTSADPQNLAGLTALMADLMTQGAGDLDAQAFQQALADKAIKLNISAGRDEITLSLQCLSRFKQDCFALLEQALHSPRFDKDALERARAARLAGLERRRQNPASLAYTGFYENAFPGHPYGRSPDAEEAGLRRVTAAHLRDQYERHLARDNALIAIVGDMSQSETRRLLTRLFGALPENHRLTLPAFAKIQAKAKMLHQARRGPQTTIYFGHQGIGYDHPDFFAHFVMNHILGGGGFTSRLTEEVREARGLAYSVVSYLSPGQYGHIWLGTVASDNKTAQQALDIIRDEMRRLADERVSADRLAAAQTYLTGAYALRFDSGSKIAGQLIGVRLNGLSADYFQTRNQAIRAVTPDDIQRAARSLLQPDRLIVSAVGGTPLELRPATP
ncbi:MAG: M16 family metallopeptidase [Parvibaculales bacterium]